jgi:hypothetical protein
MNDYRYFLTGRADGFIVSLTIESGTSWSILADETIQKAFSKGTCEDFRLKIAPLNGFTNNWFRWWACSTEVPDPWQQASKFNSKPWYKAKHSATYLIWDCCSRGQEITATGWVVGHEASHIIINPPGSNNQRGWAEESSQTGDCWVCGNVSNFNHSSHIYWLHTYPNSHECGPNRSKFLKFVLSDGDHWLFGVLRNPEINEVGSDTRRECFYATVDNSSYDLSLIEQIIELLAVWVSDGLFILFLIVFVNLHDHQMAIPGNMLYDCFFGMRGSSNWTGGFSGEKIDLSYTL